MMGSYSVYGGAETALMKNAAAYKSIRQTLKTNEAQSLELVELDADMKMDCMQLNTDTSSHHHRLLAKTAG